VQESREWTPPVGTLGGILAESAERVKVLEARQAKAEPGNTIAHRVRPLPPASLAAALRRPNVSVIAEVKRRSPSRGELNAGLSAAAQARRFERAGAAAASILTEPRHFGGALDDLRDAAAATRFPLLRKDFHISPLQLVEAHDAGASAALLIARALPPRDLQVMIHAASAFPIETVVEVRTGHELELALAYGARMIGVNARDLETLQVDDGVPERLIPTIPADVIAIWESGIATRADVERAAAAGADAVLVGSALSLSDDPEALLAALTTVPRRPRG
jgi:indole-3-glycerol phosphate synthase